MFLHKIPNGVLALGGKIISSTGISGRIISILPYKSKSLAARGDILSIKWDNGYLSPYIMINCSSYHAEDNRFETIDYP